MFKRIPVETKNEILAKVKGGQTVVEVAKQYAVCQVVKYPFFVISF